MRNAPLRRGFHAGSSDPSAVLNPRTPEPPMAQEVYRILDDVMSGILTDEDADIDKLLSTAETRVDEVLADR